MAVVVAGLTGCSSGRDDPAALVSAYQRHVVDGDIEAALALDGTHVGPEQVLLRNAAYATAKNRMTDFTIESVHIDGDSANVRVRTVQKSGKRLTRMALTRKNGRWRLLPASLGYIEVQAGPDGIAPTLGGQPIPVGSTPTLYAFPGDYELSGTSTSDVHVAPATTRLEGYGSRAGAAPAVAPTPEAQARLEAAAQAHLDDCAAQGDRTTWPDCPFLADTSDKWWTASHWNIERRPVFPPAEWEPECRFGTGAGATPGCWMLTSEEFDASLTVSGDGYETTAEPAPATVRGWTKSFSPVDLRPLRL
ncbi:hypothetical protein DOE76_08790 [Leifsonia sp. ku-ls]|nr:hypothetical protein DOE76_08790 [Leifsonia sp. ku-ls]